MVVLDAMEKMAGVRLLQAELNDRPGVCLKLTGPLGDLEAAAGSAEQVARSLEIEILAHIIAGPSDESAAAYLARPEFNPLIEQATVHFSETTMNDQAS